MLHSWGRRPAILGRGIPSASLPTPTVPPMMPLRRRKTEKNRSSRRRQILILFDEARDTDGERGDTIQTMVAMSSREALRGEEVAIFDRMAETMTSTQWAEFLKAPLEVAAAHGDVSLSQKLVAAGAKVGNALHGAIRERHEQVVIDLVENAAADVSAEDDDEETPLHVALRPSGGRTTFCCDGDCAWCERVVRLLLRKGADPNTIGPLGSPLHYACTYCLLGATTALLESGADLNVRVCIDCDDDSRSVLDTAAGQASADVVRVLIKHGADVGLAGPDGDTPLHHAAYSHFAEVADVLVEAGANIQVRNSYNQTPLHIAAGRLNLTMVRAFLKHGLDANDRCQFAQTPLHEATVRAVSAPRRRREAAGVVDLLLRSGADETLVDDDGNTAGDLANKELSEVTVDEDEDEESDDTDHESAVERVRELLANAPADKAWRRRGYWALCRTHPGRLEEKLLTPQKTRVFDRTRRVTRSSVRASRVVGEIDLKSDSSSSWAGAAVWVLGLGEDAIFRTIVGYL